MKKIVIIFSIAFLAIAALSAQGSGRQRIPEPVKIEGTLQLFNGQFAVASGNKIYYVPRIGRYVGFIESLKEGANVSFEGYVAGNFLQPLKMTISGKSYDLGPGGAPGGGRMGDFNNRNDRGFNGFGPRCGPYGWNGRGRHGRGW